MDVEKSSSFGSKTTMDDDADNDKPASEKSPTDNDNDKDQDLPNQENVVDNPPSPKSPPNADPISEKAGALDSEIREENKRAEVISKVEESSSNLPPDLKQIEEDIDQYIPRLIDSKGDESVPISVEQFVVLMEARIEDYDSLDSPVKWGRLSKEDSSSFLKNVNRISSLSKALSRFSSDYKYTCSINRVGDVLQRLMSYIEEEYKSLLEDYKIQDSDPKTKQSTNQEPDHHNPSITESAAADQEHNINSGYSDEVLTDLIRLSDAMILGGYETECFQAYLVARRNALEERLHHLGFQKHSMDELHKMQWEAVLEREIVSWINIFKQCATVYFPRERKLSDTVFSNHSSFSESVFCSLSFNLTVQLLNFAESVALTKRAPEKLFKFIETYDALRDILPKMDALFAEEWMIELKTESSIIRTRLGEAMILIFNELENSIKNEAGKNQLIAGGAVHPLTKYTMNYLGWVSDNRNTLEQVFREHLKIERADSATGSEFDCNSHPSKNNVNNSGGNDDQSVKQSPFQAQIMKVMDLLDANLEGKSKLYKDPALSSIFMMNNGRYILKKIRGTSELNGLMGDTWYRKKSSDLRQYHKGYQRETWGKLLSCLTPEGLTVNGKVAKPVLKERFKSFNAMFDDIHKTQSNWVVGDEQLQSELRVSISNMVIPAYRSFLGRYSQTFTPGRQTEKYVKYQPDDIETYIDELFDGNAAPPMGKRKQ